MKTLKADLELLIIVKVKCSNKIPLIKLGMILTSSKNATHLTIDTLSINLNTNEQFVISC